MQPTCKLTIAVPVYNTARYLKELFLCIENQTLGMENMEIILVNDGSADSSAEICRAFWKNHTERVRYLEYDDNQGVSHARNEALDRAEGKYITFWDSDDLWSPNAMEKAVAFLDAHEAEADLVSCNIEYFESTSQPHILNFAVEEDFLVDIRGDYQRIRTSGSACVMRTEAAKRFRFDEKQTRWEDAKYINQLLLQKKTYGMLSGIKYYYRRRRSSDSATQLHERDKQNYLYDLGAFFDGIYEESLRQCGELIPMMQYLLAYALGYFFLENASILNKEEHRRYDAVRRNILSHIDDRYLREIPNADSLTKWKMLSFKHSLGIEDELDALRTKRQEAQWNLTRIARNAANCNALKRWFELKCENKPLSPYFERNGYTRIAIYGMSDLGTYLLKELADSPVRVLYGIDRQAEKAAGKLAAGRWAGLPIRKPEDTLPEADAIIVTAVYFFSEIDEQLRQKVTCPVISLEDVLYTIE